MRNVPLYLLLLCFLKTELPAQTPATDSIWLEANNLRICLRTDGSLYAGGSEGAVQYRHQTPQGEKWVKVVQDAGLWFGGIDPAGNLKLSVQSFEPRASDFRAGLPNVAGSDKFWQVSFDEIARHVADYSEDAVIDQPIEAIYAWPGRGNPFFRQYNGFDLPKNFIANHAAFVDGNYNGIYEPNKGEYPLYPRPFGGYEAYFPEQITAFLFHTDSFTLEFPTAGLPVSGMGFAATFNCSDSPLFENSVFFSWRWEHTGTESTDSSQIGIYLNPDIGAPNDDYQGSVSSIYFAYNSDTLYDAAFGLLPPVFSLRMLLSPLDLLGDYSPMRVMPVGKPHIDDPSAYLPMTFPELPLEYYRYLTGSWRDGRPLSYGGNGYNFSAANAYRAFPGNPYSLGAWTEVNAKNPPGDRRAVLSWQYGSALPGSSFQMSYALTVHPNEGNAASSYQRFENIFFELNRMRDMMDGLGFSGSPDTSCSSMPWPIFSNFIVHSYPNPVSDVLYIQTEGGTPTLMRLYDVHQRVVEEIQPADATYNYWGLFTTQLPVRHLPPGIYFLEIGSQASIHTTVQKIIVLH